MIKTIHSGVQVHKTIHSGFQVHKTIHSEDKEFSVKKQSNKKLNKPSNLSARASHSDLTISDVLCPNFKI